MHFINIFSEEKLVSLLKITFTLRLGFSKEFDKKRKQNFYMFKYKNIPSTIFFHHLECRDYLIAYQKQKEKNL